MSADGRRLRILHLIARLAPPSGPYNEHCLAVVDDRDLAVCTLFEPEIPADSGIAVFGGDGTVRGFWRALNRALDTWPHDVVHAHAPATGIVLVAARVLQRRSLANAVYTVQNSFRNYRRRNRLLMYPIFALFPTIVVCGEAVLETLPRGLQWLGRNKIRVVPNGVDVERIDRSLRSVPTERNGHFGVISVARLIPIKNPETLLAAFARQRDPRSRIAYVGEGHLRPDLVRRARESGVAGQVGLTGLVERDEVYRLTAAADLFVSTSRGEGLPVAVLEAMASGCPAILSDIPPHREIVGEAGFIPLVPPDDVEGFAREIRRFREMAPEERAEVGRRCRRLVEERFSLPAMQRRYEDIYRSVRRASRPGEAPPARVTR